MRMKLNSILLLTGKSKEGRKEDLFLAGYLKQYFNVTVTTIDKVESLADKADLVLVRNIWPTSMHLKEDRKILSNLIKRKRKLYNPGLGEEDLIGKEYLAYLFKKGFPVIPSIDEKIDLDLLPKQKYFFIKPKHGGSRRGCRKINFSQINSINLNKYILQPFIDFKYEISFYFIDDKLQYALYAPNKKKRWYLKPLKLTSKDKKFAQQFVKWNNLPYGLQRIDAVRLKNGKLLLMEIEDWCPYLSLLDIHKSLQKKLIRSLVISLKNTCRLKHHSDTVSL